MERLKNFRIKIDDLDNSIMELLEERINIAREIGKIKAINNLDATNELREVEILRKAIKYKNSVELKDIYKQIFVSSKNVQEFKYFLVGKSLEYSFSPFIYKELGIDNYNLFPTDDFNDVKKIDFLGINVTNPYKKEAYNLCSELDESASSTGVVNTINKENKKLVGYNTDFYGFSKLLDYNKLDLENRRVIIIGNGATANTITAVLNMRKVKKIEYLVRNIRLENEHKLQDYLKFKDFEIIINTTPYGTYPNNQLDPLFNLDEFNNLQAIIDVVYNPRKTPLLMFEKAGVKKINGLMMLTAQAAKAASIYTGVDKTYLIEKVYTKLDFELMNIVLIGMPFSGKSKLGNLLEKKLNHRLIDLDIVMQAYNHDLASVLKTGNEEDFRNLEVIYATKYSKERGKIISTGGGIVLSNEAMRVLKQNGVVIFLDIPVSELVKRIDKTRPLVKSASDLINLYNQRIDLYKKYADITVNSLDSVCDIVDKIYEYINN